MAWQCVMYEVQPGGDMFRPAGSNGRWEIPFHSLPIGAMFYDRLDDPPSLHVKIPGGADWNIDRHDRRWTRTGEAPCVTVTPSINHQGVYHGWLRDGVLTDDCEGRTFAK